MVLVVVVVLAVNRIMSYCKHGNVELEKVKNAYLGGRAELKDKWNIVSSSFCYDDGL